MRSSAVALGALATQAAARSGDYGNPAFSLSEQTVEPPTPTSADRGQGAPDVHSPLWTATAVYAQTSSDGGPVLTTVTIPASTAVCPATQATEALSLPSPPPPPPPSSSASHHPALPPSPSLLPLVNSNEPAPTRTVETTVEPSKTVDGELSVTAGATHHFERAGRALAAVALIAAFL
ncbi:hypothetical protein VTH82DRAFT_7612 [Thermothelomyces myriococcoides]